MKIFVTRNYREICKEFRAAPTILYVGQRGTQGGPTRKPGRGGMDDDFSLVVFACVSWNSDGADAEGQRRLFRHAGSASSPAAPEGGCRRSHSGHAGQRGSGRYGPAMRQLPPGGEGVVL